MVYASEELLCPTIAKFCLDFPFVLTFNFFSCVTYQASEMLPPSWLTLLSIFCAIFFCWGFQTVSSWYKCGFLTRFGVACFNHCNLNGSHSSSSLHVVEIMLPQKFPWLNCSGAESVCGKIYKQHVPSSSWSDSVLFTSSCDVAALWWVSGNRIKDIIAVMQRSYG